eukprot:CAMPEP_0170909604 /NCGR_PEP_ID=MMETSP0735-20130129/2618_1 /TAXON_ID=186038 /ORGANISM="Fragilariopsis kerguelensis, Strain L26-C5" /LENGTH=373 /DNA_ID=CAMNT_0011306187 /DNA_START=50 /DNA_END=1169 /DNA_ORIENTATION=+
MKLSSSLSFLSTTLLVSVPFSVAEMSQLQKNWNIGNVVATNVKNVFTFQYPDTEPTFLGTDLSTKVRATIYGSECKVNDDTAWYATAGYVPTPFNNKEGHFADPEISGVIGPNTELVQFTFTTVPSVMAQISDITTAVAGQNESAMNFCVRIGLYAINDLDSTSNEINFQETIVTLTVTMDGSFDITSFGVAPKDKTSDSAQQTYTVKAELCTAGQADKDSAGRFNQGAAILVCISPDAQALIDGVVMTSIDTFNWARSYVGDAAAIAANGDTVPADTTQEAIISSNTVSTDGLTLIDTTNIQEFIVTSVLFAAFYEEVGSVKASGEVEMSFARRRRLGTTDNRRLQEADPIAAFDVDATLNKADDGPVAIQQ